MLSALKDIKSWDRGWLLGVLFDGVIRGFYRSEGWEEASHIIDIGNERSRQDRQLGIKACMWKQDWCLRGI